jgi:hypothetical protein
MPLAAEQHAEEIGMKCSELYSYQFALVPDGSATLDGFVSRPFGTRTLVHCPKLEVARLTDANGTDIGVCLGIAVDRFGVRIASERQLDVEIGNEGFWEIIESLAIDLAGRWLLIVTDGTQTRIYGDAAGMYNCVYDPVKGGVGSTLLMSLLREIAESDEVDYTRTISDGLRLPFGRTRDAHARRLAVNHYLTLEDWSETRFWPKPGMLGEAPEGEELLVVAAIRDRLAAIFAGIATSIPTAVGVSGGNDSRNLVAAGKDTLGHIRRFYSWTHNFNSRTDFRSAALMMETLGYPVERHMAAAEPYTEDEIADRNARYERMTGYSVGLHQMYNVKMQSQPPAGEVIMTGNVMEALRAAHWKSPNTNRRNVLKFGLKRCLFVGGHLFDGPFVRQWLPHYRAWMESLPPDAQQRYIDVTFVEHNLPNLGTTFFSYQDNFLLCPFNDRRIVQLCAQLPVDYRFRNEANRDFLAIAAPELSDVSFAEDLRRGVAVAS